jgi:glycosyltransferase involved in cell wall biosynthesis
MKRSPILSICIPTYNRIDKLNELVTKLLATEEDRIEIVVLDNRSDDNTGEVINRIQDPRLKYFLNEINLGGPINHVKVLTLATGEFCLLCLDKDTIDISKMHEAITYLTKSIDVSFGYFKLNIQIEQNPVFHESGIDAIVNMAYLSAHPSGMFYRTKTLKKCSTISKILLEGRKFPFYPDVINAEMAQYGDGLVINLPFIFTETTEECASVQSYTYSSKDLFFYPHMRFKELEYYLNSMIVLKLNQIERNAICGLLIRKAIYNCTLVFRDCLKNSDVCQHYGVKPKRIGFLNLLKEYFLFIYRFLFKLPILDFTKKIKILCSVHISFLKNEDNVR